MKKFEEPIVEMEELDLQDVLTTSQTTDVCNPDGDPSCPFFGGDF